MAEPELTKAIVTGGSRGIGREIVLTLLRSGAEVWYITTAERDYIITPEWGFR